MDFGRSGLVEQTTRRFVHKPKKKFRVSRPKLSSSLFPALDVYARSLSSYVVSEPAHDDRPVRELVVPVLDPVVLEVALGVVHLLPRERQALQPGQDAALVRDDPSKFEHARLRRDLDPERTAELLVAVQLAGD